MLADEVGLGKTIEAGLNFTPSTYQWPDTSRIDYRTGKPSASMAGGNAQTFQSAFQVFDEARCLKNLMKTS